MPNLVGIGLSQVPTNSMLGGLAYQDPEHASIKNLDLKNLSQINSEIADTAVDVFVYDTRKDSDGGAWRKRTQNTSWYNETLGTATRGTRKEFPAVAVIVAESTQLTIYDGDDPDLPMWMVFNLLGAVGNPNSNMISRGGSGSESDITCIACLNGRLAVGLKDVSGSVGEGLAVIDFISELARIHRTTASGYTGAIYNLPISGRNSNGVYSGDYNTLAIVAETCNDVAMTVLPNAPVDSATGLPIPTIAVATDGGLSIIRDDGTVVNKTRGTNETHSIAFDEDNSLIFSWGTSDNFPRHLSRFEIADWIVSANISFTDNYFSGYNEGLSSGAASRASAAGGVVTVANSGRHFGIEYGTGGNTDDRLGILHPKNLTNYADQNLSAFITSSYNTGYMHGDVKGAFLSDTDTTNAVGTELVTNPGPNFSDTSGWGATNGTLSISSGDLLLTGANNVNEHMYSSGFTLTSGKTYVLNIDSNQLFSYVKIGTTTALGTGEQLDTSIGAELKSYTFTATASGTFYLKLGMITSYVTGSINSVSLRLAEEDRSVNNNGLQVFGTVTKSPVATGADLVAYSGFSASNYLQQPYNSDLNFGTGDFSFMAWIYPTNDNVGGIISRGSNGVYGPYGLAYSATIITLVSSSDWNESNDGGSWGTLIQTASGVTPKNVWSHVVAVKSGTTAYVYTNGVLRGTDTSAVNPKVPTSNFIPTMIGAERTPLTGAIGRPFPGSLALVRASASAPSAEQVKKMYEDEKHLFQENAKATLYGSSDAVTALAFDDATNLLHVGTSAGRSEFQGLRRINNTTDAVTTAISASNGLVAEQ